MLRGMVNHAVNSSNIKGKRRYLRGQTELRNNCSGYETAERLLVAVT